jgi:class 3 adenylate cyclase/TolB-like protein
MARDQRRLTAIVSADVAGYSRLMGRDESGTLAALKTHIRDLINPKIAEYGGRTVKSMGDGLLLEFPSVVDAVRCAVDVQRGMSERNVEVAPDRQIQFRIGINVGDIIIDGEDIFGDGVNVAARLQGLADAGGICVSRGVRDQVLDKLSFTFVDLGAQRVKNIARPVDVYRVDLVSAVPQAREPGRSRLRLMRAIPWRWTVAGVLALGLAGIGLWALLPYFRPAPALTPPSGSFAVLPFTTSDANSADGQLADALAADLSSALQRGMPEASIVSHRLALTYKGKSIDARAVGRELNVRYLVEGDVRTAGGLVVVKARIIDATKATEVWNDEIRLEQARVAEDRSELVTRLTVQAKYALYDAEQRRVLAEPVAGASAADLTVRADALLANDPESTSAPAEARKLYDQALKLDPSLTTALMGKTLLIGSTLDRDPNADHDRLVREYEDMSARLVAVAGREARAWNIRADALQRAWRWEAALEANARAQKIDPSRVGSMGQRADILVGMGRAEEALAQVDRALSLQPPDAPIASYLMGSRCHAYMALGRYDDAIAACEKDASLADSWVPHVYLVAAYALLGNAAKVEAEKAKLMAQRSGFAIADFKALKISDVPAYLQQTEAHLYSGLRKAGIPER